MRIVSLEELTEQMVLARPLYRDVDMTLLNEGAGNLNRYKKNFERFGFQYFCVQEDPLQKDVVAASALAEMRREGQELAALLLESILLDEEALRQGEWQAWLEEVVYQLFSGETILKNMIDLKNRDVNLYMHSINVAVLAVKIGKARGYTISQQLALGSGAMLHDIGMLLISDALRQKTEDAMDDTERKIYRTHPQISCEMLHAVEDVDELSRTVVLQHHEQMDGRGYPYGVPATKLHEMARIVSVCDEYDDLIRNGKNGAAVSPEAAAEYLVIGTADRYDRTIVEYFLKSVPVLPRGNAVAACVTIASETEKDEETPPAQSGLKLLARQQSKVERKILQRYRERFETAAGAFFCGENEVSVRNRLSATSFAQVQDEVQGIAGAVLGDAAQAQNLKRWNEEMIGALLGNQAVLAHMLEMKRRAPALYVHSVRVAALSLLLGKALHYTGEQLISLGNGALLLDIGKLLLSDALRHKVVATCTAEERKVYAFHPRIGNEMLVRAGQIDELSQMIVLQHHEQADGRGYPQGLRENNIHPMSRVVAICDQYAHLLSAQTGSDALLSVAAIKQLLAAATAPFDKSVAVELAKHLPVLAQSFAGVLPEIEGKRILPLPPSARLRKFALRQARVRSKVAYDFALDPAWSEQVRTAGTWAAEAALRHFVVTNELHATHLKTWVQTHLAVIFTNWSVMAHMSQMQKQDEQLYMHSISVSVLAMSLGNALGYTPKQLTLLGEGAMLHDIGMLLLPDALRQRSYRSLNEAERKRYCAHPAVGYRLLRTREDISRSSEIIALCHHERLDGKGYPRGISREEVEEWVRIVSICDVYDGLTRQTRYGAEMPPYQAVEYLVAHGGDQFDRRLLAEFLKFIMLFPSGATVILSDGRKAIIEKQNKNFPARPIVRLLSGANPPSLDLLKENNLVIKRFA